MPKADLVKLLSLLGATIILLFLGIKDDLLVLSPKKKLIGQIISSAIIIFLTDVRITSFDGLFGIGELPYLISVLFSLFVFILVINAFNLIDGIDGLAGAIALIASVSFGIFALLNGNVLMTLVSFILVGALIGFLRYNLSNTRKLFLGDSGSMFTGFLLAYQGISFLEYNSSANVGFGLSNAPILLLVILSYPLLDTLRVFVIRVRNNRSPFSADRNHIHHRLLNLGLRHKHVSMIICTANTLLIGLVLLIQNLNINIQLFISVFIGMAIYFIPVVLTRKSSLPSYGTPVIKTTFSGSVHRSALNGGIPFENNFLDPKFQKSPYVQNFDGINISKGQRNEKEQMELNTVVDKSW